MLSYANKSENILSQEQTFENRDRVAIFIDGSNLLYAASQLEIEIDYTKLLRYLARDSRILRSCFYTGVDRNNKKQQGFLLWMSQEILLNTIVF